MLCSADCIEKNGANSDLWEICLNPRHCVQTSDPAFETPLVHRVLHRIVHRVGECYRS
jgi:hypothetical protein